MKIIIEFNKEENPGYIKSIQKELQKRFEIENHIVTIKDNPVPSLDNKKLIWEFGRLLWENEYGEDPGTIENPNETNMKEIFDDFLLENGVETNKEQPFFGKDDKAITFTDIKRLKR